MYAMRWQREAAAYPEGKPLSTPPPSAITLDVSPVAKIFDSCKLALPDRSSVTGMENGTALQTMDPKAQKVKHIVRKR